MDNPPPITHESDATDAAARLIDAFARRLHPEPDDYHAVQRHLDQQLGGRYRSLNSADRADVISDALLKVMGAAQRGRIDPSGNPAGYLWRVVENRAKDMLSEPSSMRLEDAGEIRDRDDRIAVLLDADASSSEVTSALRAARHDPDLVKTVAEWLRLAQEMGKAPSTREVAACLGVSHDTVARRIRRFKAHIARHRDVG